jgi:hypothetical protein
MRAYAAQSRRRAKRKRGPKWELRKSENPIVKKNSDCRKRRRQGCDTVTVFFEALNNVGTELQLFV